MRYLFLIFCLFYFLNTPSFAVELLSEERAAWNRYVDEALVLAENGDTDSQAIMGAFLLRGAAGLERDTLRGLLFLEKAAVKGHAKAMYMLFEAYRFGEGVPNNMETSLMWLVRSAEGMDRDSQFLLAMKYMHGIDFDENMENSVKWLIRSTKLGHAEAQFSLSVQYYAGRGGLSVDDIETYAWASAAYNNPELSSSKDDSSGI